MNEILIRKAKKGDKDAFCRLIDENVQSMYKVAAAYLKNDEDVADAIQDTILSCYENLKSLKQNRYFKTWMIRIQIDTALIAQPDTNAAFLQSAQSVLQLLYLTGKVCNILNVQDIRLLPYGLQLFPLRCTAIIKKADSRVFPLHFRLYLLQAGHLLLILHISIKIIHMRISFLFHFSLSPAVSKQHDCPVSHRLMSFYTICMAESILTAKESKKL